MSAHPSLGSDDFVRTKVELADRLRVSRQSIHAWCKLVAAPPQVDGGWSFQAWPDFVDARGLAAGRAIDRTHALVEIVTILADRLPARVSRERLGRLKKDIRRALRSTFPGTRFCNDGYEAEHAK